MLNLKQVFTMTAAAILATGCATYDPYTGEQKTTNAAKGAGIGAGIAAVIAYIDNKDADSKTKRRRILQAAGGGALLGGGVGYYMDTQEAKLRKQLRGSGVRVVREGDNINLVMPGNITFASDSANINASFYNVLDSVALVLEEFNKTVVVVAGHTDSQGSDAYNRQLSQQRADSVAGYLQSQKVMRDRFEIIAAGESSPVADNATASGREQNRRVEITLLPITQA